MNSDRIPVSGVGCPIRRSRDQRSLASPPGFSQRATSFIASQCQGIHQMPFVSLDPGDAVCGRPLGASPNHVPEPRRAQGQAPLASLLAGNPVAGNPVAGSPPPSSPDDSAQRLSMKTLVRTVHRAARPTASLRLPQPAVPRPVRLGHITNLSSPFNQHPRPGSAAVPRRESGTVMPNASDASTPLGVAGGGGGGERDRTDDLLLAKQALSQLSYTPAPPRFRSQEPGSMLSRRLAPGA